MAEVLELETPHGPARAHLEPCGGSAVAGLVLGHGAGGGVTGRDLSAVAEAALDAGLTVVRVEQPYRVAGRKSPAPARQLDAAWVSVCEQLLAGPLGGLPLVVGGRSSGARVACRTADAVGAVGVLCLAFPVHPPGKGDDLSKSRLGELEAVEMPVLVVQGARDPFGMPSDGPRRRVVAVDGDHSLRGDLAPVAAAAREWLLGLVKKQQ